MLVPALAQEMPVIIDDFPPSDAASTFKDFTNYVGGPILISARKPIIYSNFLTYQRLLPRNGLSGWWTIRSFWLRPDDDGGLGLGEAQTTADRMLKQAIRSVFGSGN